MPRRACEARLHRAPWRASRPQSPSPAHPNARHAQKFLIRRSVHLDGKPIEVVDSPVRFRIDVGGKKRLALIDELRRVELIEAHKPIGLIKPVLPIELHGISLRQPTVFVYRQIRREEHALHMHRFIERRGEVQYLKIGFGVAPMIICVLCPAGANARVFRAGRRCI